MDKEIKKMAQVVCDNCSYKKINDCEIDSPCTDTLDICETLYDVGCRKIDVKEIRQKAFTAGYEQGEFDARYKPVWHKVADGDLPKEGTEIYCCHKRVVELVYTVCSYFTDDSEETPHFYHYDREEGWIRQDDIIAWTELPKYERRIMKPRNKDKEFMPYKACEECENNNPCKTSNLVCLECMFWGDADKIYSWENIKKNKRKSYKSVDK